MHLVFQSRDVYKLPCMLDASHRFSGWWIPRLFDDVMLRLRLCLLCNFIYVKTVLSIHFISKEIDNSIAVQETVSGFLPCIYRKEE